MTVVTEPLVLAAPLWDSGDGEAGPPQAGGGLGGRPPGTWGPLPPLAPASPPQSPMHTLAGKFALPGLGSQAAWHRARLASERGQQGGASGRAAEDVAGRPGHEQDPRPGARGPEGEGTPAGTGWVLGGQQAGCREQASWGGGQAGGGGRHKGGQCQAALPACLPQPASCRRAWPGLRGGDGELGAQQEQQTGSHGCRSSRAAAEEGPREAGGAGAVKEKNIPRPANCCSQLFPLLLLGGKKKQCFLWRRMQKGCGMLTVSCTGWSFPSRAWAQAWPGHHGRQTAGA